jgi:hypothetical protein
MATWFYSEVHNRHLNLDQVTQVVHAGESVRVSTACGDSFTLTGREAKALREQLEEDGWRQLAVEAILEALDGVFGRLRTRESEFDG